MYFLDFEQPRGTSRAADPADERKFANTHHTKRARNATGVAVPDLDGIEISDHPRRGEVFTDLDAV